MLFILELKFRLVRYISIFGYLKPLNSELKLKHINEYKHEYCTLCYGLKSTYGLLSACLLNYECTFLYIFLKSLYPMKTAVEISFRCPIAPYKKNRNDADKDALAYASFINYHLALLKLQDAYVDSTGLKRLLCKTAHRMLAKNRKYLRQRAKYELLAIKTDELCKELYALEMHNCQDYDDCSAVMGKLLYEIVAHYINSHPCEGALKVLEFSRHIGMWIYLIDAYDDFEDDRKAGRFNPLNSFAHKDDASICLESGELMLNMMVMNLSQAVKDIAIHQHREIIENIISHGTLSAAQFIKRKREKNDECKCKK